MSLYETISIENLHHFQNVFAEAQGVATIIRSTNGNAIMMPSIASWLRSEDCFDVTNQVTSFQNYICQAGRPSQIVDFDKPILPPEPLKLVFLSGVAGIEVAGKRIASWIIWQVYRSDENEATALEFARSNGLDPQRFCDQFVRRPGMTDEAFGRVAQQLTLNADMLSQIASQEYEMAKMETGEFNKSVVADSPGVCLCGKSIDIPTLVSMVEVSSGVCHNVGNAINSLGVLAADIKSRHDGAQISCLERVVNLIGESKKSLPEFFSTEGKGHKVPVYLEALTKQFRKEYSILIQDLEDLNHRVKHIGTIVRLQQSYSKSLGHTEVLTVDELIDDAVQMNEAAIARHGVELTVEPSSLEAVPFDRHRILQILMNLISNAKYAVSEGTGPKKSIRIFTEQPDRQTVRICVADTGVGISPQNVDRIFENGFTTKDDGHGYGLHTCIVVARELGGRLYAQSDGLGLGATFVLELPYRLRNVA
jgi:signal transduction histidine kinase